MPTATVTVRELKNKDTGIDFSIPTYQEVPGRLGSVYEYNVVVVSRLSYFKSPKHKESDNVQFTIQKKFSEFEDLHAKMTAKFSGTVFPPLPKKSLIVNDATAKERRGGLENFLKFLSRTPKLSTSPLLLEFLGVNAVKAGKFRRLEVREGKDEEEEEELRRKDEKGGDENVKEPDTGSKMNLFDEEQEEDADLFVGDDMDRGDMDISSEIKTIAVTQSTIGEAKLFGDVDLGGGIQAEEGDQLLFIASETGSSNQTKQRTNKPNLFEEEEEDNSELFQIDDDLDKFLSLDLKSKSVATGNDSPVSKPQDSLVKVSSKEEPQSPNRPKPAPRTKPIIPTKATVPDTATQDTQNTSPPKPLPRQKPPQSRKPQVQKKPPVPPKPGDKIKMTVEVRDNSEMKGDNPNAITQNDILKYIQDNTADNSEDLDLFS